MLFMVISTPRPDQPSKMRPSQRGWWDWIRPLQGSGIVQAVYVKIGRGAAVVFEVESNEQLHDLVNQWSEHIPAEFQVLPLARAEHQERIARAAGRGPRRSKP
jgi:hypothetical protein